MSPKVLFFVQSLWGIGHVARTLSIAGATADAGARVAVLLGGPPTGLPVPSGVSVIQLPPVRSPDTRYNRFVTAAGEPVPDRLWQRRAELIALTVETVRPDIVVSEHFPFGRRKQANEFALFFDAARASARLAAASLRDLLEPVTDRRRRAEQIARAGQFCDLILVHADPAFATLKDSVPDARALADRMVHTGFVVPAGLQGRDPAARTVLVSGGASDAAPLLTAARQAATAPRSTLDWHLLGLPGEGQRPADRPNLRLDGFQPDRRTLLRKARVSVSRAGYNTVWETLAAQVPMVLVPAASPGQSEQTRRANRLADLGLAQVIREPDLSPETLAKAVEQAAAQKTPAHGLNLKGAQQSAATLLDRWRRARA